mgnify:CR=1 FL=1
MVVVTQGPYRGKQLVTQEPELAQFLSDGVRRHKWLKERQKGSQGSFENAASDGVILREWLIFAIRLYGLPCKVCLSIPYIFGLKSCLLGVVRSV